MLNNEIKKKEVKKTPAFYLNYRRVTTQSGFTHWIKMSGYGFSGDKNLEQTFASEGNGEVRVAFDCTLILHVVAIKQKVGVASLTVNFVINSKRDCGEVRPGVISYDEDTRKKGTLIKLSHSGRFCKNDVILIKFTNATDIRVTIFGNLCHQN